MGLFRDQCNIALDVQVLPYSFLRFSGSLRLSGSAAATPSGPLFSRISPPLPLASTSTPPSPALPPGPPLPLHQTSKSVYIPLYTPFRLPLPTTPPTRALSPSPMHYTRAQPLSFSLARVHTRLESAFSFSLCFSIFSPPLLFHFLFLFFLWTYFFLGCAGCSVLRGRCLSSRRAGRGEPSEGSAANSAEHRSVSPTRSSPDRTAAPTSRRLVASRRGPSHRVTLRHVIVCRVVAPRVAYVVASHINV